MPLAMALIVHMYIAIASYVIAIVVHVQLHIASYIWTRAEVWSCHFYIPCFISIARRPIKISHSIAIWISWVYRCTEW